jgi:hypothetical protein
MTSAQIAWTKFSSNHIQREGGAADEHHDDHEENFDMPFTSKTSTSTSTTSTKSKRIQFSTTGHLIDANNRNNLTAATAATTATISPAAGFEQVKKAKTRSERRAEEPEVEPEAEEPVARKERRSDYWVRRDDLRRGNARTMKNQFQLQLQEFEEWNQFQLQFQEFEE